MVTKTFNPLSITMIFKFLLLSGPRDYQTDRSASSYRSSSGQTCPCTSRTSSCWACHTPKVICHAQDPSLQKKIGRKKLKMMSMKYNSLAHYFINSVIFKTLKKLVSGGSGSPPSLTSTSTCHLHVLNTIRLASGPMQLTGLHLRLLLHGMDESTTLYTLPQCARVGHPLSYSTPQVRTSRFRKSKNQVEQGGMDGNKLMYISMTAHGCSFYFYVIISWRSI